MKREGLEAPAGDAGGRTRGGEARSGVVMALERVERSERDAIDGLREAICGFVGALQGEGSTRDEIIEAVRALVAEPRTPEGERSLRPAVREALVELAVYWCVDELRRKEPNEKAD